MRVDDNRGLERRPGNSNDICQRAKQGEARV